MPCLLRPLQARCTLLWPVRCNPAGPPARGGRGGCCGYIDARRRGHQCRRRSRHRGHNACRAHGFCGPANGSHTRGRTTRRARAGTGHGLRLGRWPIRPRCRHPASAAGVCSVCARRGSGLAAGCSGGVRGPRRIGSRCGTCARTRSHNGPCRDSGRASRCRCCARLGARSACAGGNSCGCGGSNACRGQPCNCAWCGAGHPCGACVLGRRAGPCCHASARCTPCGPCLGLAAA